MESFDIIEDLSKLKDNRFPNESLCEAIRLKDKIEPYLLSSLDNVLKNKKAEYDDMLHIYSLFLLAQFKCKAAYKKIIDILNLSYEQIEDVIDSEILFNNIPGIIISVYDGNHLALIEIIENTKLHNDIRLIALLCICYLTKNSYIDLDKTIPIIKKLAKEIINNNNNEKFIDDPFVIRTIIDAYFYLNIKDSEYLEFIKKLYDLDLVDYSWCGNLNERINCGYNVSNYGGLKHIHVIEDTIKEMSWWACFNTSSIKNQKVEECNDISKKNNTVNNVVVITKNKKKNKKRTKRQFRRN
jgi:Protein of unknown function (DUF1186)